MSKRKATLDIGYRAAEELYKLFPKNKAAATAIGCDRKAIRFWELGCAPDAIHLQRLAFLGVDVHYVLTGIRKERRNGTE